MLHAIVCELFLIVFQMLEGNQKIVDSLLLLASYLDPTVYSLIFLQ